MPHLFGMLGTIFYEKVRDKREGVFQEGDEAELQIKNHLQ